MTRVPSRPPIRLWHGPWIGLVALMLVVFGGHSRSLCALALGMCSCAAHHGQPADAAAADASHTTDAGFDTGNAPAADRCPHCAGHPAEPAEPQPAVPAEPDGPPLPCCCLVTPATALDVPAPVAALPSPFDYVALVPPPAAATATAGEWPARLVGHAPGWGGRLRTPQAAGWLPPLRP